MTNAGEAGAATEPLVLELRVHGVNNTTPASLLDLPPDALKFVSGDRRAAFWVAAPGQNAADGTRGHIPDGVRREAYSWGGLVRTEPGTGRRGRSGLIWDGLTLAFQVFALPFSIGNAAMWTRRLTTDTDKGAVRIWANVTAGAARLFGLMLTLLFTSTAITIAVDMAALQCAADTSCTWAWDWLWGWVMSQSFADLLTPSRILGLFTLVPVLAVGLLVWFARLSRRRYDNLHERDGGVGEAARSAIRQAVTHGSPAAESDRKTALAQRAFWSNRITGRLALIHYAAAIALTTAQVSLHVGLPAVALAALAILAVSMVAVCALPTMTITPRGKAGDAWTAWVAWSLLGLASGAFVSLLVLLANPSLPNIPRVDGLHSDDLPPSVVVTLAAVLALSGLVWRPRGVRAGTAWLGCAPAVFMTISLTLAMLTSSAVISLSAILLTGWGGPAALAARIASQGELHVPDVFIIEGGLIAVALAVSLVVIATFWIPRKLVTARAQTWTAPVPENSLSGLVDRRRRRAALIHLVEPAAGALAALMMIAIVLGLVWTRVANQSQDPLTAVSVDSTASTTRFLLGTTWTLTGVGAVLSAVIALGALLRKPGLVAIVWDITCYLPRTAQPFGPPCYAEHAVPDIAQRLDTWLRGDTNRRAVLAAHSMGAVIAVSALGLLAATTQDDQTVMRRVSLLSFGVQLRTYFGRLFPEMVGPAVLGTYPARSSRPWTGDPWARDSRNDNRVWDMPPDQASIARLKGELLPADGVRWINLWRLTDYLGFPAAAARANFSRGSTAYVNGVDRYAEEIDRTVKPPIVVTHNDYIRVPAYQGALFDLEPGLRPRGATGKTADESASRRQ